MNKTPNSKLQTPNYKKILLIRLDKMGDIILSTPAIKAMRNAYPNSHIAFMAQPYVHDILKGNPYLDEVILYDKKERERGFFRNLRFVLKLRKKKFDLAVAFHPSNRTHMITFFAGIPERIGYDKKMGYLLTRRIPHTKQFGLKHEIDNVLDLLRYMGVEAKEKELYVSVGEHNERHAEHIFRDNGIGKDDIIVALNPGASCLSKKWPWENFVKVADGLADRLAARIVIVASAEDKPIGNKIAEALKARPIDLSGATTVGDLASILRRSSLLISNDSGPVHMASALGTPTIVIFGRSNRGLAPARWGPTGKRSKILQKDIGCEICLAHNCKKGFKCLEAITVEDVLDAAKTLLGK
ncbi:MAG: lipopolysaccharide heptosyltransferase II [Candidatus Omnitrophica bacterium]|nr:lipopolysaccharide heptosyltransferase II [Candidatus Omnitrophota bacterium]